MVSFFITVWLALWAAPRRGENPDERLWAGRLAALAGADLLLALSLAFLLFSEGLGDERPSPPRVGAQVGEDLRVRAVHPGSPAEEAGLREGDLIVSVGGKPVTRPQEVAESVQASRAGTPLAVVFEREGVRHEVAVTPVRRLEPFRRRLFEPVREEWLTGREFGATLLEFLPAVLFGLVMALVARGRTPGGLAVWGPAAGALVASGAAGLAVSYALFAAAGGVSMGGYLLAMLAQVLAMAGAARVFARGPFLPPAAPAMKTGQAILLGALYLVTGTPRVAIPLAVLSRALIGEAGGAHPLEELGGALDAGGIALFVLVVVVAGPWAEELLFRGLLFRRLEEQGKGVWAVWVSSGVFALVHPNYRLLIPVVFFDGLILAWARLRTGGLGAPVVLHMLVNGAATLVYFLR